MSYIEDDDTKKKNKRVTYDYNGMYVECILTKPFYPKKYLKDLFNENEVKSKEAFEMGTDFTPKEPNILDSGLFWEYAIIGYGFDKDSIVPIGDYSIDNEKLVFGNINSYPPTQLRRKGLDTLKRLPTPRLREGSVNINQYYPSVYVCKDWATGKLADEIKPEEISMYRDLYDRENNRLNEWNEVIKKWESETEVDRLMLLGKTLSMKYLLCEIEDDYLKFHEPEQGLRFKCFAKLSKGKSQYLNLYAFEESYFNEANEKEYRLKINSGLNTITPSKEDILLSELLKGIKDNYDNGTDSNFDYSKEIGKKVQQEIEGDDDVPWNE